MGRGDARNMLSFITEQIWVISASGWLFNKKLMPPFQLMKLLTNC
jgi:hypothetical protein